MMKKLSLLFVLLFCILTFGLPGCGDDDDDGGSGVVITTPTADNNVIFATSVEGDGNLGGWADAGGATGLAAGDNICQARAQAAGLSGTFVAVLSDNDDDAYCRIHGYAGKKSNNCGQASLPAFAGPWVRTDDFPFALSADELFTNGAVYTPPRYDEFGLLIPQWAARVRTGTSSDGALQLNTCLDWTSSSNTENARRGNPEGTTSSWVGSGTSMCDTINNRLYCMQTGAGPALPAFTSTGKTVFITSVSDNGNLSTWADAGGATGLAAGDAICQARALAAGLANASNFKAWLSSSALDAIDRLISTGPWVRLDGVKIANNKADLTDGELFTAISQDEFGDYYGNYGVWTGTEDSGLRSADTCNDWIDGTANFSGLEGVSSFITRQWSYDWSSNTCDSSWLHLYCFED